MAPPTALTLAIETSNPTAGPRAVVRSAMGEVLAGPGVALGRAAAGAPVQLLDQEPLADHAGGSDDLVPAIQRLCGRNRVAARDLRRVAVSVGPGGYTGLRTAIAAAKLIAEVAGARTIAVPSAAVAARAAEIARAPALVFLASKAQTAHATLIPRGPGAAPWWEGGGREAVRALGLGADDIARLEDEIARGGVLPFGALALGVLGPEHVRSLRPPTVIADRFLPPPIRAAAEACGAAVLGPVFTPAAVLQLADGLPGDDPALLAPVYPREPDAVTLWKQRSREK